MYTSEQNRCKTFDSIRHTHFFFLTAFLTLIDLWTLKFGNLGKFVIVKSYGRGDLERSLSQDYTALCVTWSSVAHICYLMWTVSVKKM